jgi:threonine synthase
VLSYAVEGSYDDCLALVMRALEDRELSQSLNLTSANAVNIGRIVAQVVLAFEAVARLKERSLRDAPVMAVPCGSCGNLYAALLAQRMGLPVKAFVIAANGNDAVPRFLDSGRFESRKVETTLAQAMDVGHPLHWERIQMLFEGKPEALRTSFRWGSNTDAETRKSMWELNACGFPPDPHTAVAHGVLQERLGLTEVGILLATAHPAKSAKLLQQTMNLTLDVPEALAGLEGKVPQTRVLPADFEALKTELLT